MNKLNALSKLANAFHYIQDSITTTETLDILDYKFNHIRRSLRIEDLKPAPKDEEGFNGRMPTLF